MHRTVHVHTYMQNDQSSYMIIVYKLAMNTYYQRLYGTAIYRVLLVLETHVIIPVRESKVQQYVYASVY